MGILASRQNARIEENEMGATYIYRYPPKSGNYFSSHFIMGGERFEITQPEAYLFGENMDLNFLGGKPTPFPYPAPQTCEATLPLRSLMNIRKESLRFVKPSEDTEEGSLKSSTDYNIEFTFDSDVSCAITICYFCAEEVTAQGYFCKPRDPSMNSETYHYKRGISQQFVQVSHIFNPSKYPEEDLTCRFEDEILLPVVVQCVAEEGEEPRQSHTLIAAVEKNSDSTYSLKPLKQKLFVDGLCYLMQEIYGIENKNVNPCKEGSEDEIEDSGAECVICMSNSRDTLILPCRHLCLCNSCADSLRYQANNCPICRSPFRALLQIRTVRKSNAGISQLSGRGDTQASPDVPLGYEPVSLLEALNGPYQPPVPRSLSIMAVQPPLPLSTDSADVQVKSRSLERLQSSSVSSLQLHGVSCDHDNKDSGSKLLQPDRPTTPEVVIAAASSFSDKTHPPCHRKGSPRSMSGPEKVCLLRENVQIVNEVEGTKTNVVEQNVCETRSLLNEGLVARDGNEAATSGTRFSQSINRTSPLSMSAPHSLHQCDSVENIQRITDTSPGGDSDYFTPEDPTTTILVDQGTDTSLDRNQPEEMPLSAMLSGAESVLEIGICRRPAIGGNIGVETIKEETLREVENEDSKSEEEQAETKPGTVRVLASPSYPRLILHQMGNSGTPASNISNQSCGDSPSSSILQPQHTCNKLTK